ncbi:hypothetical protein GGH91_005118 [Coemansia sp. RSA 2671]|uniref:Uncharacterized protein n=1 Tax=Coemansia linderi TaxID=2663919 RepID=A0ACC1KLA7_9FUNG|nr:hypothetical protein LPJ60_003038 [Coemansia sp. RSA 2675]KAJ2011894.1 hypothetical protein GGI06_004351 [Coemansia sp. S85]KAJ2337232.1 hypothetical protein GGH91_005118 [Coemansia sp. RSA 2671]KAJ2385805.1 hypothetical protein H4S02_004153 [Coemansia sp. RSA 2611]KAJ2414742.1 hypothetical protein GGI10_002181 [Coemansia sp. RSA 2530]KAJ2702852.1 hypothetical protein H4218_000564 [Coemansia sp. IMI 209128]KAJ2791650.1 hypothetical protein GGI18_000986 [Coemansia linderi]
MSASALLSSFNEAHLHLVTRASSERPAVYMTLIFKAYHLRTTSDFALAYFFLIFLGIVERLGALGIDSIRDKPGQPWRIFPRACIYYVITIIRYVLMMAIMNGYVPMLLITCLGLALGQIIVEGIRYFLMTRAINKASGDGAASFAPLKTPDSLANDFRQQHQTTHLSESCC